MFRLIMQKFTIIFLSLIAFFYVMNLIDFAEFCHGYSIADWLINYAAGFVRRGLGGFLFLKIAATFKVLPNYLVLYFLLFIYALMLYLFVRILKKKEINIWFLVLLVSPYTFLFTFFETNSVGRKELLLFTMFLAFIYSLNFQLIKTKGIILLFTALLTFTTFIHEMVLFYSPYFLLTIYFNSRQNKVNFPIWSSILVIIPFISTIIIYFTGRNFNGEIMCEHLLNQGLKKEICNGIIFWPNDFGIRKVFNYALSNNYFPNYTISLLLGLIPNILFLHFSKIPILEPKKFIFIFLLLFGFSLPIFTAAIDWGRWLNIHFTMMFFFFTIFLKNIEDNKDLKQNNFSLSTFINFLKVPKHLLAIFVGIFYILFLQMHHEGSFEIIEFVSYHEDLKHQMQFFDNLLLFLFK